MLAAHEITAVVPCYNEEECLRRAHAEISEALTPFADHEIVYVDDGSTDGTLAIIRELADRDPRVRYLSFTRNFGLEAAFSAGFRYARHPWTVQFDADLQSPPSELPRLFGKALEGYDAVFAMRVQRNDPWHRRVGSQAQHWLARRVFGIELPHRGSIFRVLRSSVAKKIVALDLGTPYFLATVALVGARYTSLPTEHRARLAGSAKWNLRKLVGHTVELYTGFSYRLLGLVYLSAALCGAVAVVGATVAATGWGGGALLGALALAGVAILALDLAIVGRYLVRIIRGQTRSPARYLVRETNIAIDPADSLYELDGRDARDSVTVAPPEPVAPVALRPAGALGEVAS
jgi:glycosyltransferase involved in cell wall biosynthesis